MSNYHLLNDWEEVTLGSLGIFFRGHGGTRADEMANGLPCIRYGDLYTHHNFIVRTFCSAINPACAHLYSSIN
jgi:type I restriction enzyme, S subunit